MPNPRKTKKPKTATPGYFSDPELDVPRAAPPPVHRFEEVESYSKVNRKLNVSSGVIDAAQSPRKPNAASGSGFWPRLGQKRARVEDKDDSSDDDNDINNIVFLEDNTHAASKDTGTTPGVKTKPKRPPRRSPLLDFIPRLDTLLDEMLRLEGLGDSFDRAVCKDCHTTIATPESTAYQCRDCDPTALWCKDCCVASHTQLYLHRIQAWVDGACFERVTLQDLGLQVQLGHLSGAVCPHRDKELGVEFVIIDSDEVHVVTLDYCQCHQGIDPIQQLLWAGLLPATMLNPRTAATFRVLETFQMLSFTGKVSAYEFLIAIQRRTDNTISFSVKKRNREWMRIIHLFRHLRMLKRGGRGHLGKGVVDTEEGELAVLCPACPQPGINMRENWESLPEDQIWIHALFLAMDANFRLQRKTNSSDENDPGLNHGYAYIVAEVLFKAFLRTHEKEVAEEKTNCSNHDTIKSAQVNKGKGEKAASGLGACQCACHDMKRPCGAGDLQKGERHINMDYVFLSTLRFAVSLLLVISYDIVCQWSRNLRIQCALYPPNPISRNPDLKPIFCVPKFHAPAHVVSCHINYSFNLTPRVGRTDGEAPERGWSAADQIATSTREMGPGNRHDTLDDFIGALNWEKCVLIAEALAERGRRAVTMAVKHGNAFKAFSSSIPQKYRKEFMKKVKGWEGDRNLPNPHENPEIKIDVRKTRLKLSQEDEDAIKVGLIEKVHEEMTGSLFILEGIEIKETQRRVQLEFGKLGAHSTDLDRSKAQEHKNSLYHKLINFIDLRQIFLPSFAELTESDDTNNQPTDGDADPIAGANEAEAEDDVEEDPWQVELNLPSDLLPQNRKCDRRFVRYEFLFRVLQAHTMLKELRAQLLQQDHMVLSKKKYTCGNAMLTMSHSLLRDIGARIKEEKRRYRAIHAKLWVLWAFLEKAGSLEDVKDQLWWMDILKQLKTGDARGLTCLDGNKLGEGDKELPWIWQVGADAQEMANISLRVEFCRTRARAHRWQEECLLLAEEMRRVERFWTWDAKRWQSRAVSQPAVEEAQWREEARRDEEEGIIRAPIGDFQRRDRHSIIHGKMAYAVRQARIRGKMLEAAKRQHEGLPALLENGPPPIECINEAPPALLPMPVVPKKPINPGGRGYHPRKDQPAPNKGKEAAIIEESDDEDDEGKGLVAQDEETENVNQDEDEEDPGKTYDDTDDES